MDDALAEDTEERHNKREDDDEEGWGIDHDICTDGGTVIGFFDGSHPQPYDNSRLMWYVDDPHHERPLVQIFESAVGFYALILEFQAKTKMLCQNQQSRLGLTATRQEKTGEELSK